MTCDMIKRFNSKMNEVLENKEAMKEKIEVDLDCLSELFFPELKKVYDCIIISSENLDELEANFESSIEFLGGKNFYEVSETEILMNSYLEDSGKKYSLYTLLNLAQMVVYIWQVQLNSLDSDSKFCFIISCDEKRVTLRFHKVREGEPEWLADDLDLYDEPVGYIIC